MNDAVERDTSVDEIVTAYLKAVEAGDTPDRSGWLRRYPALACELAGFFADLDGIDQVVAPLRFVIDRGQAADGLVSGVLGDFRLVREVGRGGMGVVYEAEQISLGRRVALKVLPFAATMDPKHLQRFHNEARAAASLHHEHIVPVFGVGCERGVHYYAMQFIDGTTLAAMIDEMKPEKAIHHGGTEDTEKKEKTGPSFPPCSPCLRGKNLFRRIAELIAQAADALEHAHSTGVVHRDVKPGNLMVDGSGKLWVTDFGLARFGADAGLTMTGDLLGTLRYMSPEQALAKHGLVDHRADVYALGATLYELLTGRPAVDGEDRQEILRRIAFEETIAPRKLDKSIPAELETITLKCLAKNPSERYATASEVAADLRRWLDHQTIKAKPPTVRQRTAKWARRHRPAVWAAAVSAATAIVALAGSVGWVAQERTFRRADAERRADEFLQQSERLYGEGKVPEALAEAQKAQTALDGTGTGDEMRQRVRQAVDNLIMIGRLEDARIGATTGGDLQVAVLADQEYERAFREYGIDVDGLDLATATDRIRSCDIRPELAAALDGWAFVRRSGRPRDNGWKQILAVARAVDPDDTRDRVRQALQDGSTAALAIVATSLEAQTIPLATLVPLSDALISANAADQALRLLAPAWSRQPDDFWVNYCLATAHSRTQPPQPAEALRFYTAALASRPRNAGVRLGLSVALRGAGRQYESDVELREIIRVHPDYAPAYNELAWRLRSRNDLDGAIAAEREAIRLAPNWGFAYCHLGMFLNRKGDLDGALAAHRESLRLDPTLDEFGRIAGLLRQKGDWSGLVAEAQEALRRNPNDAQAQAQLRAGLANTGGRAAQAEADAAQKAAVRLYEERIRRDPTDAEAYLKLAWALPDGGKIEARRKVELARKAVELAPTRGAYMKSLSKLQYLAGDWADAVTTAESALPIKAGNVPLTWMVLALAHARRGDMAKARRWYEMAKDRDPLPGGEDLWREAEELFGPPAGKRDEKPPPTDRPD